MNTNRNRQRWRSGRGSASPRRSISHSNAGMASGERRVHRLGFWRRHELHAARRGGPAASPRCSSSVGMASGLRETALQLTCRSGRKPAARNQREGARARGAAVAHRPYDPGRPGAGWDSASNTGRRWPFASQVGSRRAERWGCHGLPSTVVRGPLPGISSPVLRPPGRLCASQVLDVLASPRFGRGVATQSRAVPDPGRDQPVILLHQARAGRPSWDIDARRPTSTSMSCSTSSAGAWAGWLPIGTPRSPRLMQGSSVLTLHSDRGAPMTSK